MTPSPYDQLNAIADRLERERNEARAERDQLQEENGRLRALMTTCGDCTERDRYRAALVELVGPEWGAAYDAIPARKRRAARNHDSARRGTTP